MKIFKTLKFTAATLLGIAISLSAVSAERQSWYAKPDGDRPSVPHSEALDASGALYLGPDGDKTVYLTFDAGYSNENVESVLDTLASHGAKGAFFILPGIVKYSPETVKRMSDEGHTVCNHSTTHGDMSRITDIEKFKNELTGIEDKYRELTGRELSKYFRPPQGAYSEKTLEFCKTLGYTPVFWSCAYADWDKNNQMSAERALSTLLSRAHDGMVLLLHPTSRTNAELLDRLLTELESRGYSFGTLDELKAKCNV